MSLIQNFKQLETKQKVILVITIIAFIYVIYLGYDTFFANQTVPPANTIPAVMAPKEDNSVKKTSVNKPVTEQELEAKAEVEETLTTPPAKEVTSEKNNKVVEVKPEEPTPEQMAMLAESQEMQREYLRLVNQYQIAQLQERLESANASIAAAKLKSAITAAETEKLNNKLKQQMASEEAGAEGENAVPADFVATLKLMYVGKHKGSWMAMLNADGAYYEVKVGTRLPDGSTVSAIDTRGIVLTKNDTRRYIAMPKGLD